MPLDRIVRDKTINVEHRNLAESHDKLRARCATLQGHVDAEALKWLEGIPLVIHSLESAISAERAYDRDWFASKLWSKNVKAKVAQALADACSPYPTVNVRLWKIIARSAK